MLTERKYLSRYYVWISFDIFDLLNTRMSFSKPVSYVE